MLKISYYTLDTYALNTFTANYPQSKYTSISYDILHLGEGGNWGKCVNEIIL